MHLLLAFTLMSVLTHSIGISDGNYEQWEPYFSEKFSCYKDVADTNQYQCCGYMANGERECAVASAWTNVGGTNTLKTSRFSLCSSTLQQARNLGRDLCCANDYFSDCGVCAGFMIWEFESFQEMADDSRVTFDLDWKEQFLDQPQDDTKAYDNNIFPAGFVHAKLHEFNDPPVCTFIPSAGGRVIEIRVEPEESGNTVCFNDLYDDTEERNNPGQITSCDDTRLRTCFSDGDLKKNANDNTPGFPFFINCVEGCEDSDINLWFRARASDTTWVEVENQDAESNMEMWCNWMDRNATEWDTYPSEIAPPGQVLGGEVPDSVTALSVLFVSLISFLML
jgi:hypothetical protein